MINHEGKEIGEVSFNAALLLFDLTGSVGTLLDSNSADYQTYLDCNREYEDPYLYFVLLRLENSLDAIFNLLETGLLQLVEGTFVLPEFYAHLCTHYDGFVMSFCPETDSLRLCLDNGWVVEIGRRWAEVETFAPGGPLFLPILQNQDELLKKSQEL